MPLIPYLLVVVSLIAMITFIVIDNVEWQKKAHKREGIKKPKMKLKKGQTIVFLEGEYNPFDQVEDINANTKPQQG